MSNSVSDKQTEIEMQRQVSSAFASRFPPRHLETCRPEISKLDLGTIKNGSAASDLPPEGPKKKSWAVLTHLAHISKLALETIKNGSAASDLPPEDPKKTLG